MKLFLVTYLSETFDLNSAESFVFKTKSEATKFINDEADCCIKACDGEIMYDGDNYVSVCAGDDYFSWTIQETEI